MNLNELIICAIEQGYSLEYMFEDKICIDLGVYLRLKEIEKL